MGAPNQSKKRGSWTFLYFLWLPKRRWKKIFYSDFRLLTKEIFVNDIEIWFQRETHFTPSISWRIPIFKNLLCLAPQDRIRGTLESISYIFTLKTDLPALTSEPISRMKPVCLKVAVYSNMLPWSARTVLVADGGCFTARISCGPLRHFWNVPRTVLHCTSKTVLCERRITVITRQFAINSFHFDFARKLLWNL